jgi:hypothetical protein
MKVIDVLIRYLVRFLGLWIIWFWFFALDGLGLVIDTFVPAFSPPRWLYWAIPAIGFLIANVKLFAEVESKEQQLQSRIAELESSLATEKKSIAAALAMLVEEINQNLEAFMSFWKRVKQVGESSRESPLVLASRFTDLGPPALISTVWEEQRPLLTKALSGEQLRRVQSFYNQLTKVTKIHFTLRNLRDEQKSLKTGSLPRGSFWGVVGVPRPFDKNAPALWEDLEQIALRLIEEGSPLEDRTCQ